MDCSMTSSRATSLTQLSELTRRELALVRDELQPVMQAKREILVQNQLDGLQSLAEREQALAAQLTALEAQRIWLERSIPGALYARIWNALKDHFDHKETSHG